MHGHLHMQGPKGQQPKHALPPCLETTPRGVSQSKDKSERTAKTDRTRSYLPCFVDGLKERRGGRLEFSIRCCVKLAKVASDGAEGKWMAVAGEE